MDTPVARHRTRTIPVARQRVRSVPPPPAPVPTLVVRIAPYFVTEEMPKEQVCRMGEVNKATDPLSWTGWPNGSLVMGKLGTTRVHRGRTIKCLSGKYHAIRWNAFNAEYQYVKLCPDHASAMLAL